jgi:hypothetical protein
MTFTSGRETPPPQRPPITPVSDDRLPEPHAAVTGAADETEMPLPSDPQTFFRVGCLGGALCRKFDHSSGRAHLRVESPSSARCPPFWPCECLGRTLKFDLGGEIEVGRGRRLPR